MKKHRRFLPILFVGFFLASCISNKRIVYVQDYSEAKPHNYLADTTFVSEPVDYKLQTGDILYVRSDHPVLSKSFGQIDQFYMDDTRIVQSLPILAGFTIDEEGKLDLPLVGMIDVGGMTMLEAESKIKEAASGVFSDPAIKVFMLNYFVTILGEVNRPGRYPVYNHRLNIFEAMGLAGDATDFASREEVKVVRSRDGKNHLYSVDLTDQNILASEKFYLKPNDILMVKPQKRKKYATRDVQNVFNAVAATVSVVTLYLLINDN
ncbi:MAG: polysaccharide biosynthesis/export family protein [Flavobacteriales bacterium]|nr:polysaccharide biosynthesis/export family protein [Flavobacteriales bacterium]